MPGAGDLLPIERWHPRSSVGPSGRDSARPVPRRVEPRPDNGSHPAEVGAHLLPRDVLALFGHGGIERHHVFCLFQRFEELLVSLRTDQYSSRLSVTFEHNRLRLGGIDYLGEFLSRLTHAHRGHTYIVQHGTAVCTTSSRVARGAGRRYGAVAPRRTKDPGHAGSPNTRARRPDQVR